MTTSTKIDHSFLETVHSYLEGLEEAGTHHIALDAPFPVPDKNPVNLKTRPRQQPAKTPPVETPSAKSILPPPPQQSKVIETAEEKLVWSTLVRKAQCEDTKDPKETAVILVTGSEETKNENGTLLRQILDAAGYELLSPPLHFTHAKDFSGAGVRILAMGNPALQAVSSSGMDLKIVRGMWQTTSYGKLLSTFSPSVLEGNPAGKKAVWQDIKSLLKDLELDVPVWTREKLAKK